MLSRLVDFILSASIPSCGTELVNVSDLRDGIYRDCEAHTECTTALLVGTGNAMRM